MSFTPGIPTTGQSLGQTRDPIRNNFANYNTVVSQDHVAPNATGQGKHNKSTYVVQGSPPVSLSGEIVAYADIANGNSEIFVQRDGVGTNYQLTGPASSLNGTLIRGGTTSLLGGLMLKWAFVNASSGTNNYTWAAESGSPFNSTPIFYGLAPGSIGPQTLGVTQTITAITSTTFSISANGGPTVVQIFAIGA